MALGEHPVADLEDLRVGVLAVDRDADQVGGLERLAGDPLALHQRAHGGQPVAVDRRALELLVVSEAASIFCSRSRVISR